MKALIVYDSAYGNTKAIAEAVASGLGTANASTVPVARFRRADVSVGDLLVVGSPINGWRPTPKTMETLTAVESEGLTGVLAAAFDTRVKLFIHGDAAGKISRHLKKAGATPVSKPMPFYVGGTEGPLLPGETDRAKTWGAQLLSLMKSQAAKRSQ
ncbi:flavodoxin family protein [Paenarthrobacter sp. YJN-D]|jgi:flavodoxin|uniref:flavodoxin family protein n=1 Tax=Paenarthrobacter TaxID=1742992 RepID=UPI001877D18A|nr:flavodoxin family protein [Paenarthrobacter sp. YJN-D]QOT20431.1 flavodoxin family protein [Paenarthrobacter sp. YJN-D]